MLEILPTQMDSLKYNGLDQFTVFSLLWIVVFSNYSLFRLYFQEKICEYEREHNFTMCLRKEAKLIRFLIHDNVTLLVDFF